MSLASDLDLHLRAAEAADHGFCRALFHLVRTDEMQAWAWDATLRAQLLDMQFASHEAQWRAGGQADERLVLAGADGAPIGRLILLRKADALHVADLSLLPDWRGRGIGSHLLRRLRDEAQAAGLPLRLFCLHTSRALALYLRLGFRADGGDGVHLALTWDGAAATP